MVLKKENSIYIAVTTWGWSDDTLIAAIFGFLPDDKETQTNMGSENSILWSKTNLSNDICYSIIDSSVRLHKLNNDLDFTVTNYGDIIIYRTSNCSYTPQEVLDSYNRYISSRFFTREEYPARLNTIDGLSLNCKPVFIPARGNGKSVMTMKHMLNSIYGLNGGLRWDLWDTQFKLYFGVERATGKQKTVCLWKDGDKTIIRGDKSVLRMPVQYAVAWCYVKRRFETTSKFKKYVDSHSHIMDGITYFEGDARAKMAQASVNNRTKKYDIYDAAALAITAKHYGSVKTIMNYCDGWDSFETGRSSKANGGF